MSTKNIKLNKVKFKFKCDEVSFIGHTLTQNGLKIDPAKVEAITKMSKPKDVAGVQRFIGMVKYLAKFLPRLSEVCEPLRNLTHKDAPWVWGKDHDKSFADIQKAICEAPVLKYFDHKAATEGMADASSKGLGFVLMQEGRPVLACTCESKVKAANEGRTPAEQYVGFALHFWGECYGRTQAQIDSLATRSKSERCTGDQTYKKCYDTNPECTGHAFSEFVYKLSPVKDVIQKVRGCDLSGVTITCARGTIKIENVKYGKRTSSICGDPLSVGWDDKCQNAGGQTIIHYGNFCSGRATCHIPDWAKDPDDPCPAVKKFVDISYLCKM
eukprot:gene14497-5558_t